MFTYSSIKDYQFSLHQGTVTCVDAVSFFLNKINSTRHLNAFVHVFEKEALLRAEKLDQKRISGNQIGKLHGVVVSLKDVICFKDHPVSAASAMLKNFISVFSATVVEKLLAEDAIIIGTCNCDEFAMGSSNENSVYGNVFNAEDESRVPGGSSGGSAVSVQAGLCMISLGSDTGGSVRQPADFCGVIGLKPTYGRVSRHGLIAYASSFDQIGILGKTIDDISLVLEVISGDDEYDSTVSKKPVEQYSAFRDTENKKYRIAYFKETIEHPSLDPEIAKAIRQLFHQLNMDGHQVTELNFEYLDYIVPTYYVLTTAEASSNLSRYDGVRFGYRADEKDMELSAFYKQNRSRGFGKEVKRRIMLGTFVLSAGYYDAYFTKAQQVRKKLVEKTEQVFKDFDFLCMPTSPNVAFKTGEKSDDPTTIYLADIFTVFANLTGIPAISVPLFRHSTGMSFGIQVMSKKYSELSLLLVSDMLLHKSTNG